MSRSGYSDDCDDQWGMICWRGAVTSAIRGKRGQAFLREMLAAMDALPEKKLIAYELEHDGEYCAIGTVGHVRGIDMSDLDPEDWDKLAEVFGVAPALIREIEFENDEWGSWLGITPEKWEIRFATEDERRFLWMRNWIIKNLRDE